ncbi:MAG: cell division protein ZipA C-terminal FtsZ-binding domain-containing protein [Methylotenera sp.]|nr:cell division protein ZipA C-terminal FtsZ-binding domain-containing protein [Methylotenera sp.]MDO9232956.1 cell division protein ZipA C-terminal FtsZ-binding domain-containing protein [Methylotenera sp.]MDP2102264.1 cell division protein ZipA C-terminal FtsZ-binding domain-containing protein [Methylotenera sp.]MDP2281224.1 cell division protein ZipA C-terminal FtsZ-binding domain-containing protein [Methylotenera sp.]MDP2403888.1 cell division protein ZipA C-terminal FtsZ-binding domain-co
MSDLQIVLIVIGALIIAAVLILNWWQERRFNQQVESSFTQLKSDALLDEPTLDISKLDVSQFDHHQDDFASSGFSNDDNLPQQILDEPLPEAENSAMQNEDRFVQAAQYEVSGHVLADEASIEATYAELINKSSKIIPIEAEVKKLESTPEIKPAQHHEIKAIFDEAFSQPSNDGAVQHHSIEDIPHLSSKQAAFEEPVLSLPAMLHSQMDLTAVLYLAAESSFNELNNALHGLFDGYEKPVYIHALDSNKQWLLLSDTLSKPQILNQQASRLTCSLQLADRAGPISRNMLNRFQLAVETLGLDINAHVEWQSSGDALTAANALDAFCMDVDKTMGFHLVHGDNGAFTGTKLRGLAESQGLVLSADGAFKYFDEATATQALNNTAVIQKPSFIMFNRDQHPFSPDMLRTSVVKAVSFQLDIPHVKHCAEVFNHMVQVAKQMETGLNAVLVDANNKVLGDMQIEKIRQQLKVIHATMLVRGIVPGSESALRLFS